MDEPIRLLYSGNIGGKQDLLTLCRMVHDSDHHVEFVIQGDGSKAAEIKDWLGTVNDSRFIMRGLSDELGLAEALARCHAYVITERSGAGSSFLPSKLIPGMTSGAPILAVCDADGPLGREVISNNVGHRMGWDDPDALNDWFNQIRSNPDTIADWSQASLDRAQFYDREAGIDRCASALQTLMQRAE